MSILSRYITPKVNDDGYAFSPSGLYRAPPAGTLDACLDYFRALPAVDDPEMLENLDAEALKARYEQAQQAKNGAKEDYSDMVAEHNARASKKRKA